MIMITRSEASFVDAVPDVYVENEDYLLILKDEGAREVLLESLDKDSIVIDSLGIPIIPGKEYIRLKNAEGIAPVPFKKEVGYHHKLSSYHAF